MGKASEASIFWIHQEPPRKTKKHQRAAGNSQKASGSIRKQGEDVSCMSRKLRVAVHRRRGVHPSGINIRVWALLEGGHPADHYQGRHGKRRYAGVKVKRNLL